jgi:hypothetical protein
MHTDRLNLNLKHFEEIIKKENSFQVTFGQLTALATTQVG